MLKISIKKRRKMSLKVFDKFTINIFDICLHTEKVQSKN